MAKRNPIDHEQTGAPAKGKHTEREAKDREAISEMAEFQHRGQIKHDIERARTVIGDQPEALQALTDWVGALENQIAVEQDTAYAVGLAHGVDLDEMHSKDVELWAAVHEAAMPHLKANFQARQRLKGLVPQLRQRSWKQFPLDDKTSPFAMLEGNFFRFHTDMISRYYNLGRIHAALAQIETLKAAVGKAEGD